MLSEWNKIKVCKFVIMLLNLNIVSLNIVSLKKLMYVLVKSIQIIIFDPGIREIPTTKVSYDDKYIYYVDLISSFLHIMHQ